MADTPTCFMAMPIRVTPGHSEIYHDGQHWMNVMTHLFEPAIEKAGFRPVRPIATGAYMIHAEIVKNLETCDLVLCDSSQHNPNVTFELGIRVAVDKPMCLVKDDRTRDLPFDTSGINTYTYASMLHPWNVDLELDALSQHIRDSVDSCAGSNPMWQRYGLQLRAHQPDISQSPEDARIDLILQEIAGLRAGRQSAIDETPMPKHFWEKWGPVERTLLSMGANNASAFRAEVAKIVESEGAQYAFTSPALGSLHIYPSDPISSGAIDDLTALGERYPVVVTAGYDPAVWPML
jgi:hypothetical protein